MNREGHAGGSKQMGHLRMVASGRQCLSPATLVVGARWGGSDRTASEPTLSRYGEEKVSALSELVQQQVLSPVSEIPAG